MIEPLTRPVWAEIVVEPDQTPRVRAHIGGPPPDPGYTVRLVASFTDAEHTWHMVETTDLFGQLVVLPHRKTIYLGGSMTTWALHTGITTILVALATETPHVALGRLGTMTQWHEVDHGPVGGILDVRYEPSIDAVVAERRTHFIADAPPEPFYTGEVKVHERVTTGVAVRVGGREAEICEDVTGHGTFTERVMSALVDVAMHDPKRKSPAGTGMESLQACTDLVERVWELHSKGAHVAKRKVRDVSKYGDKFGYSTERERPEGVDVLMQAAQALLVQAGSVNDGGRNPEHVDLFIQRVLELEGRVEEVRGQLDTVAEALQLAKVAVGKAVLS